MGGGAASEDTATTTTTTAATTAATLAEGVEPGSSACEHTAVVLVQLCASDAEEVASLALTMFFYWVNFGPLT